MTTGRSSRVTAAAYVVVIAAVGLTLVSCNSRAGIGNAQCIRNLRQIALALERYHDEHGRYPPAYLTDSKGIAMHSWRVLLLKYLDKELYDLYDFDEPWDGPNNKKLLSKMPAVYACPNNRDARQAEPFVTDYLALVGPNSPFQPDKSKSKSEIFVGTIFIAHVMDWGILWMEPSDFDVSKINQDATESFRSLISSKDPWGDAVILGDLSIGLLWKGSRVRTIFP